jgi:hypothetical protein
MTIEAKVIAHSSYPGCPDLITVQARYPRFIHAECKTHRLIRIDDAEYDFLQEISLMDDPELSRNASSSRAVPIDRMIQEVLDDPAMPVEWGGNQPGMQAGAEIARKDEAVAMWLEARDRAVEAARDAQSLGLHKQIVNRLIEPFGHISVVITATDWDNFFKLRIHPDADPTMRALAEAIKAEIDESEGWNLRDGEWHNPYGPYGGLPLHSAARCARVSYLNHDGTRPDRDKDLALANMLMSSGHWSPFEHQAYPAPGQRHANLNGWISQRTAMGA